MEDAPVGQGTGEDRAGDAPVSDEVPPSGTSADEPQGNAPVSLSELEALLRDDPQSVGFFQAVRLLERLRPDRAPVGGFAEPGSEVARFGVHASLAFPPGELHALELREDGPSPMVVNFMGLVGPQGVLPHDYTREVGHRRRQRDGAMGDFLDLFHHRILSLFYRAWRRYRFDLDWEDRRRDDRGRLDRLTEHLLDLIGMNPGSQRAGLGLAEDTLAGYAAFLAPQQRSAAALEQLVEEHFGVPAEVEQFVGGWYPLVESDQCAVGEEFPSSRLGAGAVVGDEVWDQQARIRIRLGPMSRARFDAFLPSAEAHGRLRDLVRLFTHGQFDVDLQLVLEREEVSGCVLGGEESQPLGWATWVRTKAFERHADDTILKL